ncbi:MAG: coenzyme F420-0:L-glutamate ligase [Defluviitaleaceae bacterium]|nr:coenzyme F420-0:L-glutamate ligase [Defluviitaleaceae bacterium]
MRYTGTQARGIRLPIINSGDPLAAIVADYVANAAKVENFSISDSDIVGITEAVVAKAQGNYATLGQLAADIRRKYPDGKVGVVFPILSRNRFLNILKGIAEGAEEVFVLLSYPSDEVGNPVMDVQQIDEITDRLRALPPGPIPAAKFREIAGDFKHPFTEVDYISLYESVGAKVYFSADPRDILKLTPHALAADIHTRFLTANRLKKAGAATVFTLSDILTQPIDGSGCNAEYGVLGSNIAAEDRLKLFPRECDTFVLEVQKQIHARTGAKPEVMVYGDGAFKDPVCGIWELADPVVSPAFTSRLKGQPYEIKMKMVADTRLVGLSGEEQEKAIKEIIRQKSGAKGFDQEGTTPRRFSDLLGSLCDLMSGSGDKGTPVVLIQGYFDSYAD